MVSRAVGIALLTGVLCTPVGADNLYRWTDADGRVHFSDQAPPPATPALVERLPLPQYVDPGVPAGHYSVTQQWRRLYEERLAREQERRERRREVQELALRKREVEAAERAADSAAAPPPLTTPVWIAPRPHRPWHRPGKPLRPAPDTGLWKPDHPAYRPPPHAFRRPQSQGTVLRLRF
jgi:hypothetical protein